MRVADYDPRADHDRDLFAVLGVAWNAGEAEVKAGWRATTLAKHPDTGGSHDEFLEVQYAWEVLSEPTCRSMYVRAYLARHPRQEGRTSQDQGPRAGGSRMGEQSGTSDQSQGSGRRTGSDSQRTCTGVNSDGSLCTRPPMAGSERCTMHYTQTDEEIDRILRTYARNFFCKGTTKDGMPCGNPPSKGSDYCWRHGGPSSSRDSDRGTRQRGKCPGGPGRGICIHTCLVGEEACWDHATEAQRQAAVRRVEPGRCAAVTQRGFPCSQGRWQDFPLCHSHVTGGLLSESLRGRAAASESTSWRQPQPPPDFTTHEAEPGGPKFVLCPSCRARNQIRSGSSHRCGRCKAMLPSEPGGQEAPPPPPPPQDGEAAPPRQVATLEGVGWGRSRSFVIPPRVRTWRLSWSCGPKEGCPFMRVAKADSTWDDLGTIGGLGLRQGFSHFSETGEFFLDSQINDWWRAEIDVIE